MQRREFLAGVAAAAVGVRATAQDQGQDQPAGARTKPFRLKYAPHFGMFRNHAKDPIDQIQFMHDQGFSALEDNGMRRRPVEPARCTRRRGT